MKDHVCKFTIKSIALLAIIMASITAKGANWTDNGTYSISWYDKNKTIFDISTPQELAGVAYLVNNNFTNFSGKTLNITSDLNLEAHNWVPIGIGRTVFQGSIEGNHHTISNISINSGTSGSPYGSGMWVKLQNSTIKNLTFEGKMNIGINYVGFIASSAVYSTFDNVNVKCSIHYSHPDIHTSTSFAYDSRIAGMISETSNCNFANINVNSTISFTFGSSSGNNCYGKIEVDCGGLVGKGANDTFTKCHAINNITFIINGYVTSSPYTGCGDSFVTYGGIIGRLSGNSSKIVGCLAENTRFMGKHSCGTFDTTRFRFGGIVGYMSQYDYSDLKNCVAINKSYDIEGHSYTWQASWYHTNSYFGGIAYETPKNYAGCYSNNDVSKSITRVETDRICENGSTSFSESQMHTQSFVDELNFYSQLAFDEDYWTMTDGKLSIKRSDGGAGIENIKIDNDKSILMIYDLHGNALGVSTDCLEPGIYIVKYTDMVRKVIIR